MAANELQVTVSDDQQALVGAETHAAAAAAAEETAANQLTVDQAALQVATNGNVQAQARLAGDRARLRGLALGVYTGALTGPQPAALESLSADQQAVIDGGEVNVIAEVVVDDLGADIAAASAASQRVDRLTATVSADESTLTADQGQANVAEGAVPPAAAALVDARRQLAAARRRLAGAQAGLREARAALVGPASLAGQGLSIMGSSALNAAELTTWFDNQGYADLTSTTITELANWYLTAGAALGVRGDVAFAQAVLETGGFSSPDAANLNNYAGIGHCDTCATGWPFPSPHGGVVGQLQLLRIFAGAGTAPKPAPAPVLPALTPANQDRRDCCPTWEALTGVWATDPSYSTQILLIYEQMLAASISASPTASGQASG